jgi:hypothetical protein
VREVGRGGGDRRQQTGDRGDGASVFISVHQWLESLAKGREKEQEKEKEEEKEGDR